ncbi:MAG: hypothetical protein AB7O49_17480 [Sphingomonadales bacterium]
MLKVFGFVRRNPRLTHEEYGAAHAGFHASYGRRLTGIRGYVLNVRASRPLAEAIGADAAGALTRYTPDGFDEAWDGWGQLMFDDLAAYLASRNPVPDRAGPNGLEIDPLIAEVGGDGPYLYSGSAMQFAVDEHIAMETCRPERRLFKLAVFCKRPDGMAPETFRARWAGEWSPMLNALNGLRGQIVNFRTDLDVLTGFVNLSGEAFTPAGIARRETFYSWWDAIAELWFDGPENLAAGLEPEAFNGLPPCFAAEVVEGLVVAPDRSRA